ncbi:MAG: hypothetical protein JNJ69_05265 [Leptospiraceae bacterium]|nr:hypothetical protein [Leptospiraceae bacterium]
MAVSAIAREYEEYHRSSREMRGRITCEPNRAVGYKWRQINCVEWRNATYAKQGQ